MPPPTKPSAALLDAFRSLEAATDIGVLLVEEGFDAVTMRVFSAWQKTSNRWRWPGSPCPDEGRPTPAAWQWLVSGWSFDYAAIAEGANVSREVARDRITVLVRARVIYPDGTSSKHAGQALQATVASRLVKAGAKQQKQDKPKKTDGDKAN